MFDSCELLCMLLKPFKNYRIVLEKFTYNNNIFCVEKIYFPIFITSVHYSGPLVSWQKIEINIFFPHYVCVCIAIISPRAFVSVLLLFHTPVISVKTAEMYESATIIQPGKKFSD